MRDVHSNTAHSDERVDRRTTLKYTGVLAAASLTAIAGCADDEPADDDPEDDAGDEDVPDDDEIDDEDDAMDDEDEGENEE